MDRLVEDWVCKACLVRASPAAPLRSLSYPTLIALAWLAAGLNSERTTRNATKLLAVSFLLFRAYLAYGLALEHLTNGIILPTTPRKFHTEPPTSYDVHFAV